MANNRSGAMITIVAIAIAVLVLAVAIGTAHAADNPASYQSLQPFRHFAKGAGEGVAYEYKSRTKAQLVALLRDKKLAKKEMRVTCDVLVRQMVEAHKTLPFEGCEGAAAAIESDDSFTVVACRDEMFQRENFLTVTSEDGSSWGVWHRKCLANEKMLVYKGQPLISTTCLNVAIPVVDVLPNPPTFSQYALQVNCMSDRNDGFWQKKYEIAKSRRAENLLRSDINEKGMLPYYEVFTQAPFGDMLAERKSRPLDCKFLVRFLKKEPVLKIQFGDSAAERAQKYSEYLKQFQYPPERNVITGQWVSTGQRGWVIVPIIVPLEQFEAVLVQPEQIGDVLEPLIAVHRREFATQSNPIHVWEVKWP